MSSLADLKKDLLSSKNYTMLPTPRTEDKEQDKPETHKPYLFSASALHFGDINSKDLVNFTTCHMERHKFKSIKAFLQFNIMQQTFFRLIMIIIKIGD